MDFQNILFEVKNSIAQITINRPDKLNALNDATIEELDRVFTAIANDDSVNVVIITGAGQKAFVAGADISELNKLSLLKGKQFAEKGQKVFSKVENFVLV